MRVRSYTLALTLLLGAHRASAQQRRTVPVAAIVGTVLDSATGEVPPRARICYGAAYGLRRCSALNAAGEYVVDRLPLVEYRVSIFCPAFRRPFGAQLLPEAAEIQIDVAGEQRRDWRVHSAACDHRPLRTITRDFRGHFRSGFEESSFVPCAGDEWVVPGDSVPLRTGAWVEFADDVQLRWPRAPKGDTTSDPAIYVRWHASVVGPAQYGHMGVATFEMTVDKVFETRWPSPSDCAT